MKNTEKKYGFFTAVSMVTGSVIGSGVFFKAESIARVTAGNSLSGALSWIAGGVVMLLCLLCFGLITGKYSEGGLYKISRSLCTEKYSYYVGWFMATVYYPAFVSVLAWLCARYTLLSFGVEGKGGGLCMLLSAILLVISFGQNALFPAFSGKVQIVTLIIKMIPLAAMAVFGIHSGLGSGILKENFSFQPEGISFSEGFLPAVTSTLFAYEGWIAAASIGRELRNSRRNMPLALITGGIITATVYLAYYIGVTGAVRSEILLNYGAGGIRKAFAAVFSEAASKALTGFVAVSCLGALNGMMMGCGRAMYELAEGGRGPYPELFSHINPVSRTSPASFASGLVISFMWLLFLFGTGINETPLFRIISFDSTEMPVVTVYVLYIPLFVSFIKKHGGERKINIIIPVLAICACIFTVICALSRNYGSVLSYLCTLTAAMLAGSLFFSHKRCEKS